MLSSKMKTLACSASTACLMIYATPSQATTATFHIGVAANFYNTVLKIISAYNNYYHPGLGTADSISAYSDSTSNLETCILTPTTATNFSTNCPNGYIYDLFLAANTAAPAAVSAGGLGMVYSGVTQTPFFYATGSLVLAAVSTNIADCPTPAAGDSCGLPTTGSSIYTDFVIANPAKAPYGLAAMQVINQSPWSLGLSTTSTYPVGDVYTSANIGTTFAAVNAAAPSYAYGFVAKSQLCNNGSLGAVTGTLYITKAFEYAYNGASSPNFGHTTTTSQTYPQIVQDGIAVQVADQTATTQAEILQFINYLTTSAGNDGKGLAWIQPTFPR